MHSAGVTVPMARTTEAVDGAVAPAATTLAPSTPRPAHRADFLPFSPPCIGEEEILEVVDTLRSGWITTGPKTKRFEAEFQARVGAPAALGLNSCTAGMHTALVVLGIGPGDEVITTPMTFAASANVIEHVGARPVLVDVDEDTLNIDPVAMEAALSPRTKALLIVHYAGHPAELDPIEELAAFHKLAVVEDAAHALPAAYRGRLIGSGCGLTAFSFYATKNLTTGEGGMLTGAVELVDRARMVSLHGMSRGAWQRYAKGGKWFYEILAPGFKYNMTDIQAALGLAQLKKLTRFQQRRAEIVSAYNDAFLENDALEPPLQRPWVEHAWHLYILRLRLSALRITREQFIDELTARNIGTAVHFIPIHLHPFYRDKYGYVPEHFPIAHSNYQRMLSLPLNPGMSDHDVSDVIQAVLDVTTCYRR
jgi:dTDP-4-amino-4,6-dideoxygalactose transaminase